MTSVTYVVTIHQHSIAMPTQSICTKLVIVYIVLFMQV